MNPLPTDLVGLVTRLAAAPDRPTHAAALARHLGAHSLLIFVRDGETGVLLPAPGFPATLPDGLGWRDLLALLGARNAASADAWLRTPWHVEPVAVTAYAAGADTAFALVEPPPAPAADLAGFAVLAPLLGLTLRSESAALAERATSAIANRGARDLAIVAARLQATQREALAEIQRRVAAEAEVERNAVLLARANAELQQFSYATAHDLQEPLRMVMLYLELLEQRATGLSPSCASFLATAHAGAKRMTGLVRSILDYSISDGGKSADDEDIPLAALVAEVLADLTVLVRERDAEVSVGALPSARFNRIRLRQVFQNLIGNAIKYVPAERRPRVWISAETTSDGTVVTVRDNGAGIEPRYHDEVFDLFRRLHHHADIAGSGIGLAICRKILAARGGRIWLESAPGGGTSFHFTLPPAASP